MFEKEGKTFVDVRLAEDWQFPERVKRIRLKDVIKYFRYEACSMSGCRTLAGITSDWRPIDNLAQEILSYFKDVNVEALRRESRRAGLIPKF
jgi:hypothetical protein